MSVNITIDQYLWQAKSAANYYAPAPQFLAGKYMEMTFYVTFSHTSDSGVVTFETAPDPQYTGTWASIATVTWSAIDKAHYVSLTGTFKAIRARISTAVTTGSCDVYMIASCPLGS